MNPPRVWASACPFHLGLVLTLFANLLTGGSAAAVNVLSNDWAIAVQSYSDSAPAVGTDGTIYFGTWRGKFWALHPDGRRKWVFRTGVEIKSAPAIAQDGTIYFGCRNRKLYALREDGKKLWEFRTKGWVDSSPALAHDGTIYFGSWDKSFYALNADGTQKWVFNTSGEIVSSPAIGLDGTIYFGSHDKTLYALAPDGKKKWELKTGGPIISSPAVHGDKCVYTTSVDGFLHAVSLDGSLRWRLHTGGINEGSPVVGADGTVYLPVLQHLWAIGPDGKKKWGSVGGDGGPAETAPIVLAGGDVCQIGGTGLLCYTSPEGVLRSMYYQCGCGYGSAAIGPTGAIYVADANIAGGGFTALDAGVALAVTPWPKFRANSRNTGNAQDVSQ